MPSVVQAKRDAGRRYAVLKDGGGDNKVAPTPAKTPSPKASSASATRSRSASSLLARAKRYVADKARQKKEKEEAAQQQAQLQQQLQQQAMEKKIKERQDHQDKLDEEANRLEQIAEEKEAKEREHRVNREAVEPDIKRERRIWRSIYNEYDGEYAAPGAAELEEARILNKYNYEMLKAYENDAMIAAIKARTEAYNAGYLAQTWDLSPDNTCCGNKKAKYPAVVRNKRTLIAPRQLPPRPPPTLYSQRPPSRGGAARDTAQGGRKGATSTKARGNVKKSKKKA